MQVDIKKSIRVDERYLDYVLDTANKIGRKQYIAHLEGKYLTRDEAIKAKCFECSGYYLDGASECTAYACPLARYMPYNKSLYKTTTGRTISSEHKQRLLEARSKKRK